MADDFPSPEHPSTQIDIQSEFANQVAAEVVAAQRSQSQSSSLHPPISNTHVLPLALPGQGPPVPTTKGSRLTTMNSSTHHDPISNLDSIPGPTPSAPSPSSSSTTPFTSPKQPSTTTANAPQPISNAEQLRILRNFYMQNPTPNRRELEQLSKQTGRHWVKIREYFRQRRHKLRGVGDLENLDEPARAMGWLQVTYRSAPSTSQISQLNVYNSYKTRFDPYAIQSPLLGGQELIQLACATFTGCEMAKDEGDYVLKGLKEKDLGEGEGEGEGEGGGWEKGMDGLVEPLRAGTWLLNTFKNQVDPSGNHITQTDLYTSYATRFSTFLPEATSQHEPVDNTNETETNLAQREKEIAEFEANMTQTRVEQEHDDDGRDRQETQAATRVDGTDPDLDSEMMPEMDLEMTDNLHDSLNDLNRSGNLDPTHTSSDERLTGKEDEGNRILNPVELISLARMTFPKCEPTIDERGRFVIKGLERREVGERGARSRKGGEMFPFALVSEPNPSDPNHPFTSLLKRKLALLAPDETNTNSNSSSEPIENTNIPTKKLRTIEEEDMAMKLALNGSGAAVAEAANAAAAAAAIANTNENGESNTTGIPLPSLTDEDRELVEGLSRFRESALGKEVRQVCVHQ